MMMNVTHLSFLRFWSTTWGQYILTFGIKVMKKWFYFTFRTIRCWSRIWCSSTAGLTVLSYRQWQEWFFRLSDRGYTDLFNSRSFCTYYRKEWTYIEQCTVIRWLSWRPCVNCDSVHIKCCCISYQMPKVKLVEHSTLFHAKH